MTTVRVLYKWFEHGLLKADLISDVACTHQQPIFPFVESFTAGLLGNILITPKALGGSGGVHSGSGPVPFISI